MKKKPAPQAASQSAPKSASKSALICLFSFLLFFLFIFLYHQSAVEGQDSPDSIAEGQNSPDSAVEGQDLPDSAAEGQNSPDSLTENTFPETEAPVTPENMDDIIRMNQLQFIGTHNSYHLAPEQRLHRRIRFFSKEVDSWLYSHLPLAQQLEDQNIRQLELDIFPDPEGGIFADRVGNLLIGEERFATIPQLKKPGFKVLHVPFIDFETNTYTFVEGLEEIRDWSLQNSNHLPVMVLVEVKDGLPLEYVSWPLRMLIKAGKFLLRITGNPLSMPLTPSASDLFAIEEEILSVFEKEHIITPDDVRGAYDTLNESVLNGNWPTLKEARGRIFFTLDNQCSLRDDYLQDNPSLEGRLMFTSSEPGEPSAAFIKLNDPGDSNEAQIRQYVQSGYIVRTRSDADLREAESNDTSRRESAFNSGAQYISTDFPRPVSPANNHQGEASSYYVTLPGAEERPARCNPVNGQKFCDEIILDNLE